jgi:two-component system, chemotaxis family, CheB/CheR fusion protein
MKKKSASKSEPKTKNSSESKSSTKKSSSNKTSGGKSNKTPGNKKDFLVVGIGASAGGVKALQEFFSLMPPNSGMAFVVILHLSPVHESNLAEIIQAQTQIPVTVVNETHTVEPNRIYVVPPNRQLEMIDGVVRCTALDGARGERVAIDVFFRTLAAEYEKNAVCIVLSGTGSDGTLGLKAVKQANGFAIVQDPTDAEQDGMPRSALATRLVDWVLPIREMPEKLLQFRDSSERMHLTGDGEDNKVAKEIQADVTLREILTVLRVRTGHDFSNYKTPTLVRRIARHLQIHNLPDIPSYLEYLRNNPDEIQSLLKNLLINVTNFFRDREAWFALEAEVVPNLFAGKRGSDQVRVWSCGCASGEEAYSLAMVLSEYAYRLNDPPKIQVFATDVDEDAIAEAREHRYPLTIEADVSPERLKRFFTKEGKYYSIKKELRETVLFAPHNVLRDPPFSRLDLIACRNLLIYLNRDTQESVLEIFHFALAHNGFLFLGSSESAEMSPQLFSPVDKKYRIYSRRATHIGQFAAPPRMPVVGRWEVRAPNETHAKRRDSAASLGEIHYKLLEKIAPPSLLVNRDFDIVFMSEAAGRYLRFKGGEPTNNMLKVINPGLLADLRGALFTARREKKNIEFQNIRARIEGKETSVNILVRPIELDNETSDYLLVVFNEDRKIILSAEDESERQNRRPQKDDAIEAIVVRLEEDLARTRQALRATIEQHEVSTEELKASNEELQAINEELRSATEELETSKEELQSVNEELTTVNHELKEKMDETKRMNSDLQNLMASTDIATIFLDRDLRIKRSTPAVENLFNITNLDAGRPLEHFTNKLDYTDLTEDVEYVLRSLTNVEREVRDKEGRVFLARLLPYRTVDDRIEGVVLNFIDITERKRAEEALRESEEQMRIAIEAAELGTWEWNLQKDEVFWNARHFALFGLKPRKNPLTPGDFLRYVHPDDRARVSEELLRAVAEQKPYSSEFRVVLKNGAFRWLCGYGRVVEKTPGGKPLKMSGVAYDITTRKHAKVLLRKSEESLNLILESAQDYAIITFDLAGRITRWNRGAELAFGYSEKEAVGQMTHLIFTPEDRAANVPEKEMEKALREGSAEDERWHLRKDGSRFYVSGVMRLLRDGEAQGFVKICRDQTERLKAESALRDRQMLAQLVSMQEDERRRIARDIHDHIGQQLTVLRLKLESLKKMCGEQEICDEIDNLSAVTDQLDREVDFLAWELRPASLDDLGLRVALANFVSEWAAFTGIKSEFHARGLSRTRLAFEIETNLYRIAQEALNNIYKHAKAKNVSVLLEKGKDAVSLIVEDDGVGFNPHDKKKRGKGLGLLGMIERAKLPGGTLEIESAKGKGTTIYARIPLEK